MVDRSACELHGQCVAQAPEVFSFDDDGELHHREEIGADEVGTVEDARFLCPTQAISLAPAR